MKPPKQGMLFIFMAMSFVIVIGGCGEHNDPGKAESKRDGVNHSTVGLPDACSIITQQEIHEVLGEDVMNSRLTSPGYKMTVCSWMSPNDKTKSALTLVYHSEAPLITWEQLESQAEEFGIDIQQVEGLGDLAGWTAATGDLQVWAYGKKIQIGRPFTPHLEKQRGLVQLALTRIKP